MQHRFQSRKFNLGLGTKISKMRNWFIDVDFQTQKIPHYASVGFK